MEQGTEEDSYLVLGWPGMTDTEQHMSSLLHSFHYQKTKQPQFLFTKTQIQKYTLDLITSNFKDLKIKS